MMQIEALSFDADGVIQKRPPGWRTSLGDVVGFTGDPEQFLADIFAAEQPALDGKCDFMEAVPGVLDRWKCRATLERFFGIWTMIDVDADVVDTIRSLRRTGVTCCLTTNQERRRARYMSEVLAYNALFDKEFYSCRLGLVKPDAAYFRFILDDIGLPAQKVLFLDDFQANVDSAREVGLHAARFSLNEKRDTFYQILVEFGLPVAKQNKE